MMTIYVHEGNYFIEKALLQLTQQGGISIDLSTRLSSLYVFRFSIVDILALIYVSCCLYILFGFLRYSKYSLLLNSTTRMPFLIARLIVSC